MIVDTHVYLSRWPFRRLRGDEPAALVDLLRARGVVEAWAGSFDALLHRDMAAVNARLAEDCRRHGDGLLVPFGTVNPSLPDWEEDLRRCHEVHRMPGIRLHPGFHGYGLDDSGFGRLLKAADERGLIVQVALRMEDERTQHPLLRVPPLSAEPLLNLLRSSRPSRLVLLNVHRGTSKDILGRLAAAGVAGFDHATLEGIAGLPDFAARVGLDRVLFGSMAPYFTWESAGLKLRESGLDASALRKIRSENARRLSGR